MPGEESDLNAQTQILMCYHYTTGQKSDPLPCFGKNLKSISLDTRAEKNPSQEKTGIGINRGRATQR